MTLNNQGRVTFCGLPDIKLKIAIQVPRHIYTPSFVFYQQPLRLLKINLWPPSESHV